MSRDVINERGGAAGSARTPSLLLKLPFRLQPGEGFASGARLRFAVRARAWIGRRHTSHCVLLALALLPLQRAIASPQVDQAMTLIRATCTLPGAALEIKPTPEGRLELRITLGDGQRRAMVLARSDMDVFTDTAAKAMARLPFELTDCMEPYLNDATSGLAGLPARPTAAPPPPYVPPALPTPVMPAPVLPSPAPPAPAAAPPRPAWPTSGDLPVGAINNPAAAGAPPAPVSMAIAPGAGLAMQLAGCRAAGRNVVCDVRVANDTGKDVRLVVQANYCKLFGEDGSQSQAMWATLGNQQGDLRYGNHQVALGLIAGATPVVNLTFNDVPSLLTSIKRLEVSLGVQTSTGTEMQKLMAADVQIQGR